MSNEVITKQNDKVVVLPKRRLFNTPRILMADAYTIGANKFQSKEALERSDYYVTFRRDLHDVNTTLYEENDNRMFFIGLADILEELFYEPVTHEEIDEAKKFLATAKATTQGFKEYEFPEHLWRRIVDEFNGRPPIKITAMPEGSIVYPNEPVIQIRNMVEGFGEIAAWFESSILKVWAQSERLTQNEHWLAKLKGMVRKIDPSLDDTMVHLYASLMLTDFGCRAGMNNKESETLGKAHLYTFGGTDTFAGAYQAWKQGNGEVIGSSVNALAHRNVQAYEVENDCYEAIYNSSNDGEIIAMVSDCYDFYYAVENYILPLALRSKEEGNGKIVVTRPDSGNAKEQVTWVCRLAKRFGLAEKKEINGKVWYYSTYLKFIEGDGMTWETMWDIIEALIEEGFAPFSWGLFGVGGGLRNDLKRDNFSAKYALCSKGNEKTGVVKFSDTLGKTTLPGPFKVLRDPISLENKETIFFDWEDGEDAMITYFDGSNINKPFGEGMNDYFLDVQKRIRQQAETMPLNLTRGDNRYPASKAILEERIRLLEKYAPKKNKNNY